MSCSSSVCTLCIILHYTLPHLGQTETNAVSSTSKSSGAEASFGSSSFGGR